MSKLQSAGLTLAVLCIACIGAGFDVRAQTAKPERYTIERYLNIRSATSPTLAPGGNRVAFLMNTTGTAQVWTVAPSGGWPEQLTFYQDRVDFVRWSPDGSG
jgi:Tol biopolymer transport system component